jgi:hypothetical protein
VTEEGFFPSPMIERRLAGAEADACAARINRA